MRPSPYRLPSHPADPVHECRAEGWAIGFAWAAAWLAGAAYIAMSLVHHEPFDAARSIAFVLVVLAPGRLVPIRS